VPERFFFLRTNMGQRYKKTPCVTLRHHSNLHNCLKMSSAIMWHKTKSKK